MSEHTIAENLQRLTTAKTNIATAITNKGGTVTQGDGLEEFASDIATIPSGVDTSNDTVTAATLKSGYTAHNAAGQKITGTLLSQSTSVTASSLKSGYTAYNQAGTRITGTLLSQSTSVTASTLKSGYTAYNQAGTRITGTLLSQPTTATAETIKEGFTAYNSNGELITGAVPLTSWEQLHQKVRANDMSDISIGDQYTCLYGSTGVTWDIIGKDIDTPANPNLSHTLTLRVHSLLPNSLEFDVPEAFYACQTSALNAGTYYFRVHFSGTNWINCQFTLTQSVPVGGQLVCTDYDTLYSYASGSSTTPIQTVSVTTGGSSGTYLGTLDNNTISGNLNSDSRRREGSNDWKESAIRQWLNSNKPAGQWWTPQNPWDRPPAYAETMNGFMYDLDPEFLKVIGKTQVTTKYFDTSTGAINGTYTTEDYFFLMSNSQVSSSYSGEGTKYTPYSNNASRILYKNGSASNYQLRSPGSSFSCDVCDVGSDGRVNRNNAYNKSGVAPACNII